jgi:hypothetical protein
MRSPILLLLTTAMLAAGACCRAFLQFPGSGTVRRVAVGRAQAPEEHVGAAGLPRPSTVGVEAFEKALFAFLDGRRYGETHLNWAHDKAVRDTGPSYGGISYGTHPSVRVFYSPEVWEWLRSGRKGNLPDGAMIIKEMYPPPADAGRPLDAWTVMVKDRKGSWDGWYWAYRSAHPLGVSNHENFQVTDRHYPDTGFGLYCVNCHASAENESTFVTLRNLGDDPLTFPKIDNPDAIPRSALGANIHGNILINRHAKLPEPLPRAGADFLALFREIEDVPPHEVKGFPGETYDHVMASPGRPSHFMTSDQCMGCHDATRSFEPVTPNMIFPETGDLAPVNLSPYGEWRASMMGLSGRDPIFYAQLESERTLHAKGGVDVEHLCFRCHGVMGRRQLDLDSGQAASFRRAMVDAYEARDPHPGQDLKYGALARDGVSCTVCHHIAPDGLGKPEAFSGNFHLGPADEVYGPYDKVSTLPMQNALGIKPRGDRGAEQLRSSAMCGSCHTIKLPVFNTRGEKLKEVFEQTTYLEWLNSAYQDERAPVDTAAARSCQHCHMPTTYKGRPLEFEIANIEDGDFPFPETDHRAKSSDLTLERRNRYARHTLVGINVFAMEMFQQFPAVLGIRTEDPMTPPGTESSLVTAERSSLELATRETAKVEILGARRTEQDLEVDVRVTNLAGHGFPSGVGFRRAFLEFQVLDDQDRPLWASGRTSPLGVILDGLTDRPLASEFFTPDAQGQPSYQHHHQVIDRQDQVQVYEELTKDPEGRFTTSFLSLFERVKDNRLQPLGWSSRGPYAEETDPRGEAAEDPNYHDGRGSDTLRYRVPVDQSTKSMATVVATLYYQSIPPYYLKHRFGTVQGPDTRRLHHFVGRLNLQDRPIANWKLKISSVARRVRREPAADPRG